MRIIAGKYRGKKLIAPEGLNTRPTLDKTRESLFNILESKLRKQGKLWEEVSVFDCFAGTGALGVEALSRGAKKLFAAEKDKQAQACFSQNTEVFKTEASIHLFTNALSLTQASAPVSLVFLDPPYRQGLVPLALEALQENGWLGEDTLCVIEIEKGEKDILPAGFEIEDRRGYGKTEILFVKAFAK